jgi:hypothetical protein
MSSETPASPSTEAPKGLPPVAPPSGRFIVQLFLVPGLIVLVAVLILLGFKFLVGSTRSPEEFIKNLDSSNPDVRWRAASDLAQVLQRPESLALASDPKFGLDLAVRLQAALDDLRKEEQDLLKQTRDKESAEKQAAWETLAPRRNYALYLSACLGSMTVPVGADLLCAMAKGSRGTDPEGAARRRRRAVWALANLGENLKRFRELDTAAQAEVIGTLTHEAAGSGKRAHWARTALGFLRDHQPLPVVETLAECALDADPFLRELVAFALKYWDGPLVEPTLVQLAHDDGQERPRKPPRRREE